MIRKHGVTTPHAIQVVTDLAKDHRADQNFVEAKKIINDTFTILGQLDALSSTQERCKNQLLRLQKKYQWMM